MADSIQFNKSTKTISISTGSYSESFCFTGLINPIAAGEWLFKLYNLKWISLDFFSSLIAALQAIETDIGVNGYLLRWTHEYQFRVKSISGSWEPGETVDTWQQE